MNIFNNETNIYLLRYIDKRASFLIGLIISGSSLQGFQIFSMFIQLGLLGGLPNAWVSIGKKIIVIGMKTIHHKCTSLLFRNSFPVVYSEVIETSCLGSVKKFDRVFFTDLNSCCTIVSLYRNVFFFDLLHKKSFSH